MPIPIRRSARIGGAVALALFTGLVPLGAGADHGLSGIVRVKGHVQRDVVVWLDGVPPTERRGPRVVLDQRNLTFSPHVLAVRVGTAVSMPNNDRVFHNVFSFRDGKRFDLGLYPVGETRTVTFDKPGVSRVFCNIHPDMWAYVVSVDSDAYAVSDGGGAFSIASVPSGTYTYHAWRAGHRVATGELRVDGDRAVTIDLP